MERYVTTDGLVMKYVHEDGSETAVKSVPSCGNTVDPVTGFIVPTEVERNKFSVFISSSSGCVIGCKQCFLTVKRFPYNKLSCEEIFKNTIAAIEDAVTYNPTLRDKYVKLSFMGMGDILLMGQHSVTALSLMLIKEIVDNNLCKGIDTIDIGTILPHDSIGLLEELRNLQKYINTSGIPLNPVRKEGSSLIRLFFSLHSSIRRRDLIPMGYGNNLDHSFSVLKNLEKNGISVILHQLLLKDFNDNYGEIENLKQIIELWNMDPEIRILRYNKCSNSEFEETDKFDELVKIYSKTFNKVKYQVSAGSEIQAACGQFICEVRR